MADIRDIRTQNGTPKSIWSVQNGQRKECKKIIEIKNGVAKVVWLIDDTTPDIWTFVVDVDENTTISLNVTMYADDVIDWGDGFKSDYTAKSHTYAEKGIYTITFTDVKKLKKWYDDSVRPRSYLKKIIHPSYCTKLYISDDSHSHEGIEEIDFMLPTSITTVESAGECNVSSLKLPDGIKTIKRQGFAKLFNCESIVFPDGLTEIGYYACSESNLRSADLPDSVVNLGGGIFSGCQRLKKVRFPAGIKNIPAQCFSKSGIEDAIIPDTVIEIGKGAYSGCQYLKNISFSSHLKTIESGAFACDGYDIPDVKSLTFPETLKFIGTYAFCGTKKSQQIVGYSGITSINIPDSVTSLGMGAFRYMMNVEHIVVGAGVDKIEDGTFVTSQSLKSITIKGNPELWGTTMHPFGYDENGEIIKGLTVYTTKDSWRIIQYATREEWNIVYI